MAKQNRTVLKTYFESGDIPNQSQYSDLIDSNLNLSENNIGNINLTGDITASGNISASGTIFADNFQSTGGDVAGISFTDDLNLTGNITASGNISASGNVLANSAAFDGTVIAGTGGTSTDGFKIGGDAGNIGYITNINGLRLQATSQDPTNAVTPHVTVGIGGHITASGNISASGNITAHSYILQGNTIADYDGINTYRIGGYAAVNSYRGMSYFEGNVTASGNVSSSGTITAQNIILGSTGSIYAKDASGNNELVLFNKTDSFLGFGDTDQELRIQGNPVRILSSFTSSQDALFENDVTFEQSITASGDIIASDLILTSPNGSKFKFTVNNSGHLSLTGSAV
ncbi:hypothetical protein N9992_00740 [bacterium]|nr:hypothetical protein [bacterium]